VKSARKTAKKRAKKAAGRGGIKAKVLLNVRHPAASSRKVKLPRSMVKVARDNSLSVNVERLSTGLLKDQRARMMASDGCISNPGGPSC